MPPVPRESATVRIARALGDPTRFRLLKAIAARGEMSCVELTALAGLAQATVSHHLKVLSGAGLLLVRREGAFHHYRLDRSILAAHAAALSSALQARRPHAAAGRAR